MRVLSSLVFLLSALLLAQPGAMTIADSHEMPGHDAKRARLHLKAGGFLDVLGPVKCRGGLILFRLNSGQLVSLPSNRVEKIAPIEEPVVTEQPATAEPSADPSAPVQHYELRGDQPEPADDSGTVEEPVEPETPDEEPDQAP